MLKYKHIEASREVRLWIGQVIIPTAMMGVTIMSIPGVKEKIAADVKYKRAVVESKINNLKKKGKSSN